MKPGRNARKPWAVILMAFFCIGWLQPGAYLSCSPADACPLRAAPAEEGSPAGHAMADASAVSGHVSDQADSCPDDDAQSVTRACCQPSPAVVLYLEQALAPSSPSVRVPAQKAVFFASLRPDRLFRPPQSLF